MIETTFIGLRGDSAVSNLHRARARVAAEHQNKQFTKASLREWLRCAREPWRMYFPYRPDDMPPKGGSPAELAKLEADHAGS